MTDPNRYIPPLRDDDDDDLVLDDGVDDRADDSDGLLGLGDDERPLDPDLDDNQIDSAEADERAATDGTLDVDDRP